MGTDDTKDTGVDAQEPAGAPEEQGPATTTPEPPVGDQDDQGQAGDGPKERQNDVPDEDVPEENLEDEDRGEVDTYPAYYMEGEGHLLKYPGSKFAVDVCVTCGHTHATGQFETCDACGADLTERRGVIQDGEVVDPD